MYWIKITDPAGAATFGGTGEVAATEFRLVVTEVLCILLCHEKDTNSWSLAPLRTQGDKKGLQVLVLPKISISIVAGAKRGEFTIRVRRLSSFQR